MRRCALPGALAIALSACVAQPAPDPALAEELAVWMTGTFSSHRQFVDQPSAYYSIRMVMLPIWPHRDDGPWLYVEQAASDDLARPYRQRVYHLVATDVDTVRSDVYSLPDRPLAWSGAWRSRDPLGDIEVDQLAPRSGCSITLRRSGPERFVGSTTGSGCISRRQGAVYATAEVTLTPELLTSWDRGFDGQGRQVWGAELGPYRFDKIGNAAPD